MNGWSKEDLEEECGDEIIDQLAFLSGCYRHKLSNSDPSGWIISDEDLRKFAELIVRECLDVMEEKDSFYGEWMGNVIKEHFGVKANDALQPKCSVCGTTENVKYMGGHQPYLCDSDDCIPF